MHKPYRNPGTISPIMIILPYNVMRGGGLSPTLRIRISMFKVVFM